VVVAMPKKKDQTKADGGEDKNQRIAIVNAEKCKPKKVGHIGQCTAVERVCVSERERQRESNYERGSSRIEARTHRHPHLKTRHNAPARLATAATHRAEQLGRVCGGAS